MYQYTCDVKDPQRYSQLCLNDQQINEMTKSLLGETLQSCSKVGMNPFRALNPIPDAKSPFWKKKLPAAALPKKPKTTTGGPGRPKKSTAEDLLKVDDESEQHEARRQTRSGGSQDLISGFPNTPAPRKRNHEKTPPSSGDSSGTQMHVFKVAPGGMAKVDKKHKLGGS
ncbi:uncharacterized protein [Aegilops tauschii subsp. strangulata]|uniref:uncharacterized protein isoform X5 n=1 Tax=Aegilops tauschii subsp. strangulata TaxID=200361 RepID=UPI003CC8A1C1